MGGRSLMCGYSMDQMRDSLPQPRLPWHNHITRDVKPLGACPECDIYHRRAQLASFFGPGG